MEDIKLESTVGLLLGGSNRIIRGLDDSTTVGGIVGTVEGWTDGEALGRLV